MQNMASPHPSHAFFNPDYSSNESVVPFLDSAITSADVEAAPEQRHRRRPTTMVVLLMTGLLAITLFVVVALITNDCEPNEMVAGRQKAQRPKIMTPAANRGVVEGVSSKSFVLMSASPAFSWSPKLLAWQRTAFHFQPRKNWMNDPNGPVLYKGWYHFFYQYNPYGAIWGNIVWGHAVSRDLIHWRHLPIAMVPDHWYDINGVWTGSVTILQDGQLVMLYTGSTNESVQVQNIAYPGDTSDPLLIDWAKFSGNPVLVPPPGIGSKDFRDPTTAWLTPQGNWRFSIGSKINKTGISLVYDTKDFKTFELLDGVLHAVPGTGMWECVDFYPVSKIEENGLDSSYNGPGVKHVIKTSLDDDKNDYYALGTYDSNAAKWVPDDPRNDACVGLRYDYGTFYASKTFYDQEKKRRVLWGWIKETDGENTDIQKGWASVQAIPRTILLDTKTGSNIIQWPVEEIERLRMSKKVFDKVEAKIGSVVSLDVGSVSQLDIVAEFEVDQEALERINGSNETYSCTTSGGAAQRGALGPFGLLVHADKGRTEQTPVYFYISKDTQGNFKTFFCADQSRSSEATDVDKAIYGSTVPVLKEEKLSMRILVDHSIVESFAQRGRTSITSRIYPTKAIYEDANVLLFNNATDASVIASLQIWQLSSAYAHQ